MTKATTPAARVLVFVAAIAVALTACGSSSAARPCWKQVQDDWTNHRLGKTTYPLTCYDQAIKNLPQDLLYYSDAPDQVRAAKLAAAQKNDRKISVLNSSSGGANGSGTGGAGSTPTSGTGAGDSPVDSVLNTGSDSADSVPLPPLIVGAFALMLLAAGALGVAKRQMQARRANRDSPVYRQRP